MAEVFESDRRVGTRSAEIAVCEARIRKERKKIRKWRRAIRRESFLWRELYKLGGRDLAGAVYNRSMQAAINIEKYYPRKIAAAKHTIERIKARWGDEVRWR